MMYPNLKYCLRICCVLLSLFVCSLLLSQETAKTYTFEGEDVVFTFDVRSYAKALLDADGSKVDFADLDIYDVAVTGQFNNWSKKGWRMVRKDEYTFQLRKHIQDFNDALPLDFRYIVNGKFILDQEGNINDIRKFSGDFLEDVYKVDLSVIKVAEDGNVRFELKGYEQAQEVILAGSFNGWDEHALKMQKLPGGWLLKANLPAARYEYKFIVDGKWIHDPVNKENVVNEHGTLNSVLWVTQPVTFSLKGFPNAKTVILAGSFNDWNTRKLKMIKAGSTWIATVDLIGGKHHYKYIVDGSWITDPANPIIEDDGYGNKNSVLFVH